jgi:hypothetical protein
VIGDVHEDAHLAEKTQKRVWPIASMQDYNFYLFDLSSAFKQALLHFTEISNGFTFMFRCREHQWLEGLGNLKEI